MVVEVTVEMVRGELTHITLLWRATAFWEQCNGGGFWTPPFPLDDAEVEELFNQDDLGINLGSFSMFKLRVSSDLPDKLERDRRGIN